MDINLKSNKNVLIINLVLLLVLILSSLGFYSSYPLINKMVDKQKTNIYYSDTLGFQLNSSSYSLYYDMLNKRAHKILKPSDVLISSISSSDVSLDEITNEKNNLNNDIYSGKSYLDQNKNLCYFAIDKQTKLSEGRGQQEIMSLLTSKILDASYLDKFNTKYGFYIVIDYSSTGDITISQIHGADRSQVQNTFDSSMNSYSSLNVGPIKDMTFIYAIPKALKYSDSIYNDKILNENSAYQKVCAVFITIGILLIMFIGFLLPYNISKRAVGFKTVSKIPIEIMLIIVFFASVLLYGCSIWLINKTVDNSLTSTLQLALNKVSISRLDSLINIVYWLVVLTIILLLGIYIKHIFKLGFKEFCKRNSIIIQICMGLSQSLKSIDLKDKNTTKLIAVLAINLGILMVISITMGLGILISVIYSIALFKLINSNYKKISSDYNKLNSVMGEIASGNLDATTPQDLGIFNSLKEKMQCIQGGLQNAVQKEVKSQRMKTELITNVSHDLKTPLTAIITYVDLLKDSSISNEKREEYINILDKKSQRLKDLIEDLFEVSKINSGNISLNIVQVDVVALMKQTLLEVDDKLSAASLIVKAEYPKEKAVLPLDSQRTYRVFENLLFNISKYAMHGSRVYIDINNDDKKVQITLRNMAADEIKFAPDEVVERFVRGDKSRNTEGSGLGLAIAKSFVEVQGGQFKVQTDGDLFKVIIRFRKANNNNLDGKISISEN